MNHEELAARLSRLLQQLEARKQVRHAILGAADIDSTWSWSDAAGTANPAGKPMRSETPWFLASVTKLYIATIVLRLYEQGLIDLDTPIPAYLPPSLAHSLHVLSGVDYTDKITPTHLLGHLSGLPDYLVERPGKGRSLIQEIVEDGDRAWSPEEAVTRARDHLTPHFPPSAPREPRPRIRYSDTNYQLLIALASHVTGKPIEQLYRELLFERLGLNATWLPGHDPQEPAPEPATVWIGDQPLADRPFAMQSFGDLYSTIDDMLRFGRALFTGDAFDQPTTAQLMTKRFNRFGLPRSIASLQAPSWPIEYGLGIMRFELSRLLAGGQRIPTLIGHTGSTGSWLWYSPQHRLVITGTVDQTTAATIPFRRVPRTLTSRAL